MTPAGSHDRVADHRIELLWRLAQRKDVLSAPERAMLALALSELEQQRASARD